MIFGNTDAAAATSTVGSNSKGSRSRQLMSQQPSGLKWQASASASRKAPALSTVTELSHVGQELETNADAATSTAGSNGKGFRRSISQPCDLERRACYSKSADALTSSASTELSHSRLKQGHVSKEAFICKWKWYEYPWATIRTNDPIFRCMASCVVGESERKKLDSLPLSQLLVTALSVFDVRSLRLVHAKLGGFDFNGTKDQLIGGAVMLLLNRDYYSEMKNAKCERKIDR